MKKILNLGVLFILALSSCKQSPLPDPSPGNSDLMTFNISRHEDTKGTTKSMSSSSMSSEEQEAILDGWYGVNSYGQTHNAPEGTNQPEVQQAEAVTRAVVNAFEVGDQIGVFGFRMNDGSWAPDVSSPDFMTDLPVEMQSGEIWTYDDPQKWPEEPTALKFFAYYPYNSAQVSEKPTSSTIGYPGFTFSSNYTGSTLGASTFVFNQADLFNKQVDFMYAQSNLLRQSTAINGFVPLNFKHSQTKIRISAVLDSEQAASPGTGTPDQDEITYIPELITSFRITNIALSSIPTKGRLVTDASAEGASWKDFSEYTKFNFHQGTSGVDLNVKDPNTEQYTPQMLVGGSSADQAFLAIPHTGAGEAGSEKITATLSYQFNYIVRPETGYTITKRGTIEVTLGSQWNMGDALHYAIHIDPSTLQAHVGTEVTDWTNTFDIATSVEYTYLYVEKPEFTLNYYTLDPIDLSVFFRTNATPDEVSASFIRTDEELAELAAAEAEGREPDYHNFPRLRNTIAMNLSGANPAVDCVFYPATQDENNVINRYFQEEIILKSGIISIIVKINLVPQQPYYLMDSEGLQQYLRVDPGDDPRKMFSNCYFINPDPDTDVEERSSRKFFIPINYQIETFWGVDGETILSNDSWDVEIYAYDNPGAVNQVLIQKEADMAGDPDRNPNPGGEDPRFHFDVFSVTIPDVYTNHGNILVSVINSTTKEILWIWHLWVTDYDPYSIFDDRNLASAGLGGDVIEGSNGDATWRESLEFGGRTYRHVVYDYSWLLDRNIGATAATFDGQGGLGNTGWLMYQYGRLSPILGHNAKFADGTFYTTNRHNIDISGAVTMKEALQNPNTIYYSPTGLDWYNGTDTQGKIWNDTSLDHPASSETNVIEGDPSHYKKSLFDPSPLGYMLPPVKEYSPSPVGTTSNPWSILDNGKTYKMSSGNSFFASNNIDPNTGLVSLAILSTFNTWSNSSYSGSDKAGSLEFNVYVTKANATWDFETPRTLGAQARAIDQFYVQNSPNSKKH